MIDDIDAIFAIHADPATNRFNPAPSMTYRDQAVEMLRKWEADWDENGFGYWTVCSVAGAEHPIVGFSGIRYWVWRDRKVLNLYYRFAPVAWGKGLATEAALEAVSLWRAHLSHDPIMAYTKPENMPSQRTALRAGLERRADLDTDDGSGIATVFALGWE